jgi:hypothetical protein
MPDTLMGLTLGAPLNEGIEGFINNDTSKNAAYYTIDFEGFEKVSAIYTDQTRTVYQIGMMKSVLWNCEGKAKDIADVLSADFGEYKNYKDEQKTAFIFDDGSKHLVIACIAEAKGYVVVTYGDNELLKKSQEEAFNE